MVKSLLLIGTGVVSEPQPGRHSSPPRYRSAPGNRIPAGDPAARC